MRQKLLDAKNVELRGDMPAAAKLYEEAYTLVEQIGPSSITNEAALTVSGLVSTRLAIAHDAQRDGDLREPPRRSTGR